MENSTRMVIPSRLTNYPTKIEKEIEIMQMVADGRNRKEIASALHKSVRTIEAYFNEMRFIYDAASTAHLVAIFFRNQFIN